MFFDRNRLRIPRRVGTRHESFTHRDPHQDPPQRPNRITMPAGYRSAPVIRHRPGNREVSHPG
jgi:hypothetical protein